jgi:hypothetical protein
VVEEALVVQAAAVLLDPAVAVLEEVYNHLQ